MRNSFFIYLFVVLSFFSRLVFAQPSHPFPQAGKRVYFGGKLLCTQKEQNKVVTAYYDCWKKSYLLKSTKVPGDFKIAFNKKGWTVSEAMGYGMLIVVQMAGYDSQARVYFDGLNRFRKRYPSKINPAFMNWRIKDEKRAGVGDCATDGEIDIATALLMAAEQWNAPAYKKEALVLIKNISKSLVRKDYSLRLGDWNVEKKKHEGSRLSDFATAHFRVFYQATSDSRWKKVEEKCYAIIQTLQTNYASSTGLVPDFAVRTSKGVWHPAKAGFLEGKNDGYYGYNSCRVPWRIGLSAVYYNDSRAKKIMTRLMTWARSIPPNRFKAGYRLGGQPLVAYSESCFSAPMAVAAMAAADQEWLNAQFEQIKTAHENYYSDSINLLSLLVLTQNYWLPEGANL